MKKDNRRKRWLREHRKKEAARRPPEQPTYELVYRPKSKEEAERRERRAKRLVGTPYVALPFAVEFTTTDGTKIDTAGVQMVFNDMLLMDAICAWGEDGPLYEATLDTRHKEILAFAREAYSTARVEIPPAYVKPAPLSS